MAGLLGFTLADLTGAVDSRKRQYGNLVRGLLSDPKALMEQLSAQDAEAAQRNRYTQASAGSVMPEVAQQGQQAMMDAALNVGGLLGMAKPVYQGQHSPPLRDSGAPLHDLTKTYPDDVYGPMAAQYYGHYGGGNPDDRLSMSIAHQFKGKPDAKVTIYRAIPNEPTAQERLTLLEKQMAAYMRRGTLPEGAGPKWYDRASEERAKLQNAPIEARSTPDINAGDWVTINKNYAKEHGESALNGKYKIIKKTVRAKDIFTNGDSIHEWGYDPLP